MNNFRFMLNKFMFDIQCAYTYAEVIATWFNGFASEKGDVVSILKEIGYVIEEDSEIDNSILQLSFIENNEISDNAYHLFNKIYARYKKHYAIYCKSEGQEEKEEQSKALMAKLFNILDYTFPKYNKLLTLYSSQESHLLDKLQRTRAENKSSNGTSHSTGVDNGKHLHNDSPQSTDVVATIEQDQYVSDYDKNQVQNVSDGTITGQEASNINESYDPETIIERLDEIKKKYQMLFKDWLDEFDGLFLEEINL